MEAKHERNQEMIRLLEKGDLTLSDIARQFGVSRERVRQIWNSVKNVSHHQVHKKFIQDNPHLCISCGKQTMSRKSELCWGCYSWRRYHSDDEYRSNHDRYVALWRKKYPDRSREINRRAHQRYINKMRLAKTQSLE